MKRILTAITLTSALALSACAEDGESTDTTTVETAETTTSETADTTTAETAAEGHDHPADGGEPPAGIQEAEDPTYPVGTKVILETDHMPGMEGAEATISGAFDTIAYSVSYTPTDGGEPVTDHRWVVHEELLDVGDEPLSEGDTAVIDAEHMTGMKGAEATIDYSTDETVYMVDFEADGMEMTNHKWVTESEVSPVQ